MASLRKLRRALRERGADIKNLLVDNKYQIERDGNNNLSITDTESGSTYTFKEDGTFESPLVDTENVLTRSKEATITIWKSDGGTVYWDGDGSSLSSKGSAGSFDVAYQEAQEALPAEKPDKFAHGHIHIAAPPSHYVAESSIIKKGGHKTTMDGIDHTYYADSAGTDPKVESHESENYIKVTSNAEILFIPPNVDGSIVPYHNIEGLAVEGPDRTNTATAMIDTAPNSNRFDLVLIHGNFIRDFYRGIHLKGSDSPKIWDNHVYWTGAQAITSGGSNGRIWQNLCFHNCKSDTGAAAIEGGDTQAFNEIANSDGHGLGGGGKCSMIGNWTGGSIDKHFLSNPGYAAGNVINFNPIGFANIYVNFPDVVIGPNIHLNDNSEHIRVSGGNAGVDIQPQIAPDYDLSIVNGATTTKFDGVIGGGPLGGVDISTVTGASAGDVARTTGASAAPADVLAVFDGADWIYPTKGGSVTPA